MNYSQAGQDIFAAYINQYKLNGFYLEAGANIPFAGNNTALLEQRYDWKGISIEYVLSLCQEFNQNRKNTCLNYDLNNKSLTEILDENNAPIIIDYVSHDLDGHESRLNSLKTLDFNKYKIRCITWEHDAYDGGEETQKLGEKFLEDNGMILVCRNVKWSGKNFETWAVNPDLVPESVWRPIQSDNVEYTEILKKITSNEHLIEPSSEL